MSTTPAPKPGPRPGAVPGPRPGQHQAKVRTARPAQPPTSDPHKWGRIGEDGTAYVTVNGTERAVGVWQAGTPEEGLKHFGQRFDDLATEVALLESRLRSHPDDAEHIKSQAAHLRDSLDTASVIGDLEALRRRLDSVIGHADDAEQEAEKAQARRRAEAIERKDALAAEAESLAEHSTDWKAAGDRIREILTEWKTIRGIDRATDDQLWKRYSRARDAFNRRRGAHFAELDRARAAARRTKEQLVERANELKDSTDWNETAKAFRGLMDQWKQAGRAPRDIDDKLWEAFKGAQDAFFQARNAVTQERDKEFEANAEAKDELLEVYGPQINPSLDLQGAREKLRELQEKWEQIGYVPRQRVREFEEKLSRIEAAVTQAANEHWRRTDPRAQARAAQFAAKVEEFETRAKEAEAANNSAKAEEYRAQAKQWQEWADAAKQAVQDR